MEKTIQTLKINYGKRITRSITRGIKINVKEDEIEFIGVTSALNNSLIVGAIKNKETNQIPCSIHWNGGRYRDWER